MPLSNKKPVISRDIVPKIAANVMPAPISDPEKPSSLKSKGLK